MTTPRHNVLAVCSFVQADGLLQHTIDTFASHADLYLVPVQSGVPVPEIAEPYLAANKLGVDPTIFEPCKKWRTVERVLDRVALERFDYVIAPDDDLEFPPDFVAQFLGLLDRYDIALGQPALTDDSYPTWPICVRQYDTVVRFTNFVEVMTPCFRRDALRHLRGTLRSDISPMGYGFDLHWAYACRDAGFRMGIVDGTPISHRIRPVGRHYAGDDLHGQGYAYGRIYPRILAHEICEVGRIPLVPASTADVQSPE